jgi:beta-phosphoglucomutase-like phosphatase (HAD superfamily)
VSEEKIAEYVDVTQASEVLIEAGKGLGTSEVAVVRNLDFAYSPVSIYPLAPKVSGPVDKTVAYAMDMDGTSTTTEPLALHSLEYMVRRFTGRITKSEWEGLDPERDLPFVIGNSNFRHTEFLVKRYEDMLDHDSLRRSFFEALVWTLSNMEDKQRRFEITQHAAGAGLGGLLKDPRFISATKGRGPGLNEVEAVELARPLEREYGSSFDPNTFGKLVSVCLDLYYARDHSILRRMKRSEGETLSLEILGDPRARLVEPMPGYAAFLCLVKGWLGSDAEGLFDVLGREFSTQDRPSYLDGRKALLKELLGRLGAHFEREPAKAALVTASIAYEADAVMTEVLAAMRDEVECWPISSERTDRIQEELESIEGAFDAFVTAGDAHEARLKPHPDLYSIALHRMSIPKSDYPHCVGLEDTEPGIIALRAAGLGCAVALPNRDTEGQDYSAAARVVRGGLPELILIHSALTLPNRDG